MIFIEIFPLPMPSVHPAGFLVWYMYFLFGGCECVHFVLVYVIMHAELGGVYYVMLW